MRRLGSIRSALPGATLLMLLVALAAPTSSRAANQASELRFTPSERAVLVRINDYRAAHGLNRLQWDQAIGRMGRRHACDMRATHELAHQTLPRLRARLLGWRTYGENVGVAETIPSVWRAFIASKPHRDNILHAWGAKGRVGVGIRRGPDGLLWFTMSFTVGDPTTSLGVAADRC
jgi:uncharacterized protein YkwD